MEDELGIAHLIKNSIDFDALGLELCGIAENGKKGLEMIRTLKPDIVITDIYMPVMNGTDMITQASNEGLESQFIIISGMTQFKYAMSALNAGVCGYLLKPLNKEELNMLLEKTVQRIAKSQKIEYQLNIMEAMIDDKKKERRSSYLFNLLHLRDMIKERDTAAVNANYGFSFSDDNCRYTVGVLLLDGLKELNYSASQTIIEQLSAEAYIHLQSVCVEAEMYQRGNGFVFLCNYALPDELKFKGVLSNEYAIIKQKLESTPDIKASMATGKTIDSLANVIEAMDSALNTLQARVLLGNETILSANKLYDMKPEKAYKLTDKENTQLTSAIDIKETDKIRGVLSDIYEKTLNEARNYPCYVYDILSDIAFDIVSLLYRYNVTDRFTGKANALYKNAISQMYLADSIIEYSISYIMEMLPDFTDEGSESNLAGNIRKYMDEHLSEQLKLEDVAAAFYLSPSYFGTVFKNEIGESFSSYLQSVRINRAKELLAGTNKTVDMIAGECGYQDRKHFSKLFANVVGIKPNEYRKLNKQYFI